MDIVGRLKMLALCLFLCAASAFGMGPVDYSSTVAGVGWWSFTGLYEAREGEVTRLSYYSNAEFAEYCDGARKVYFYEIGLEGFTCKLVEPAQIREDEPLKWLGVDNVSSDGKQKIKAIIDAAKKGQRIERDGDFYVLIENLKILPRFYGLYTVSIKQLIQGSWNSSKLTLEERMAAALIVKKNKDRLTPKDSQNSYDWVIDKSDGQLDAMVKKYTIDNPPSALVRPIKIIAAQKEMYVLPVIFLSDAMGWDLISAVVQRENNVFKYIGSIRGCLGYLGADIDGDEFPELTTLTCEENEMGGEHLYYKVFPTAKELISY